jgi:hypothetical protein
MVLPKRLDDDPRLQAVRTVLLREQLELLTRLRQTIDDPDSLRRRSARCCRTRFRFPARATSA